MPVSGGYTASDCPSSQTPSTGARAGATVNAVGRHRCVRGSPRRKRGYLVGRCNSSPDPSEQILVCKAVGFHGDREPATAKLVGDLDLVIVHMLIPSGPTRHEQWRFAHLKCCESGANARMGNDHIGLAHRFS